LPIATAAAEVVFEIDVVVFESCASRDGGVGKPEVGNATGMPDAIRCPDGTEPVARLSATITHGFAGQFPHSAALSTEMGHLASKNVHFQY